MTFTLNSQETIVTRLNADLAFVQALLEEVAVLYLQGETSTARATPHMLTCPATAYERFAEQIDRFSLTSVLSI